MVSCRLLWNKILSSKVVTRSITMIVHDCPITCLHVVTSPLRGYKTYATSNDSRFNKKNFRWITSHNANDHVTSRVLIWYSRLVHVNLLMVSLWMDWPWWSFQLSLDFSL
jgi:hypothetical protein